MSVEIEKFGPGYGHLIHILKHPTWFRASHLHISRYFAKIDVSEKNDAFRAVTIGQLVIAGIRASEIPTKVEKMIKPFTEATDEQRAQYLMKLGPQQIQHFLRSFARFKVLSSKMKNAG